MCTTKSPVADARWVTDLLCECDQPALRVMISVQLADVRLNNKSRSVAAILFRHSRSGRAHDISLGMDI